MVAPCDLAQDDEDLQGLPAKWIVPPVVERTVQVLERMTRPLRAALQTTIAALEARLENAQLVAPERVALNRRLHAARPILGPCGG